PAALEGVAPTGRHGAGVLVGQRVAAERVGARACMPRLRQTVERGPGRGGGGRPRPARLPGAGAHPRGGARGARRQRTPRSRPSSAASTARSTSRKISWRRCFAAARAAPGRWAAATEAIYGVELVDWDWVPTAVDG